MRTQSQFLFCDGSFNPRTRIGVGAMLLLSDKEWKNAGDSKFFAIRTRVMPTDSIARLELMTAIWALSEPALIPGMNLFTDCKTIEGLAARRAKLEAGDYKSKRTGERLTNADLYTQFFKICDSVRPTITWLKGHSPKTSQTEYQRVFSLVDKMARKTLRELAPTE